MAHKAIKYRRLWLIRHMISLCGWSLLRPRPTETLELRTAAFFSTDSPGSSQRCRGFSFPSLNVVSGIRHRNNLR